jgi:hypothetical protein
MFFEKSSGDPLIDGVSDVEDEEADSALILFYGSFDCLEEELNETFQRVLIHVVNDA